MIQWSKCCKHSKQQRSITCTFAIHVITNRMSQIKHSHKCFRKSPQNSWFITYLETKNNQCIKLNHSSFIGTKLWWLLTFKWNDFKAFFLNKQAGTFNTQICEKYAQCSSWRFIQFPITEPKHINTNTRRNISVCRFTWLFSCAKAHSPDCPHLKRAGFHVCVCVCVKNKSRQFQTCKTKASW